MSDAKYIAHGLEGTLVAPDWPLLTHAEVDSVLQEYPQAGAALEILSFSPRPFSSASVVATPQNRVFVKRHHKSIRTREGLEEEHKFLQHLHSHGGLVPAVLAHKSGETAVSRGEWTYEVHALAQGFDTYEQALSWTPFLNSAHAHAAGCALAKLHQASAQYEAPARVSQQLVSSFSIFSSSDPVGSMKIYLLGRHELQRYADLRNWRQAFDNLLMPLHALLKPWLSYLKPLWTHNDFHASNLMWSSDATDASVTGIIDFGLADLTNAVHDLAIAIERNIVEWLHMDKPGEDIVHLDHLDALLDGYEEVRSLSEEEVQALVAMLPLVHCEFALSETDYFLSILHSEEKAYLAYEGYFLAHAQWFQSAQGQGLLLHLQQWANNHRQRQVSI